jgi:large subunit ribosomal protein L9
MHTEVILTKNVQGLGAEGDKVSVSPGYARNYLIPRGFAKRATEASLRHIEILKKKRTEREGVAARIGKLVCSITVKTGHNEKMFGAVTAGDILEWLHKNEVPVERKQVTLERPIHQVGEHHVSVTLAHGVTAHLKVQVVAAEPPPAPAAAERKPVRRGERPPPRGERPRGAEPKPESRPAARPAQRAK